MREIKFRAWDGVNNKMIYIGSPRNDTSLIISEECWNVIDHFTGVPIDIADNDSSFLMQFTGLKDKSNDNICLYEGDLVSLSGKIIGNKYENESLLKERTNLLITEMGTNSWRTTEQEAMLQGFKYAK